MDKGNHPAHLQSCLKTQLIMLCMQLVVIVRSTLPKCTITVSPQPHVPYYISVRVILFTAIGLLYSRAPLLDLVRAIMELFGIDGKALLCVDTASINTRDEIIKVSVKSIKWSKLVKSNEMMIVTKPRETETQIRYCCPNTQATIGYQRLNDPSVLYLYTDMIFQSLQLLYLELAKYKPQVKLPSCIISREKGKQLPRVFLLYCAVTVLLM